MTVLLSLFCGAQQIAGFVSSSSLVGLSKLVEPLLHVYLVNPLDLGGNMTHRRAGEFEEALKASPFIWQMLVCAA